MTAWRRRKAQGSYPLQSLFLSAFEFAAFSLNKFTLYKLHPHPFGFVNHGWCVFQNGIDNVSFKMASTIDSLLGGRNVSDVQPGSFFLLRPFLILQDVDSSLLLTTLRIQSVAPGSSLSRKLYLSLSPWITWMWSVFPDCRWNHDGTDQKQYTITAAAAIFASLNWKSSDSFDFSGNGQVSAALSVISRSLLRDFSFKNMTCWKRTIASFQKSKP